MEGGKKRKFNRQDPSQIFFYLDFGPAEFRNLGGKSCGCGSTC